MGRHERMPSELTNRRYLYHIYTHYFDNYIIYAYRFILYGGVCIKADFFSGKT